jgi:transcriptional regulator with XRE-family HTH domain
MGPIVVLAASVRERAIEDGAMPIALKEARLRAGLSLEQLAAKTGNEVAWSTIYRIETGERVPMKTTREIIASALGLAVDAIAWPERGDRRLG